MGSTHIFGLLTGDIQLSWAELLIPLQLRGVGGWGADSIDQLWSMVMFISGRQNLLFFPSRSMFWVSLSFSDNFFKPSFPP